jgi:bifunctional DNase/RNase
MASANLKSRVKEFQQQLNRVEGWKEFPQLLTLAPIKLLDGDTSQPSTQDLLGSAVHAIDGPVQHILVSQLDNKTLYARIAGQINGQVQELDSRPSDAIALAVVAQVPIYAEERLLDETGKDPFIP